MSSQAIPGYGAVPMVSLRNPVSRTRAQEKQKRSRLEIEPGGALVQSRINTKSKSQNDSAATVRPADVSRR